MRRLILSCLFAVIFAALMASVPTGSWAQSPAGGGAPRQARVLTGDWSTNHTNVRARACRIALQAESWIAAISADGNNWRVSLQHAGAGTNSPMPTSFVTLRVEGGQAVPPMRLARVVDRLVVVADATLEPQLAEALWTAFRRSRSVLVFAGQSGELLRLRMPDSDRVGELQRFAECRAWTQAADVWSARDTLEFAWAFERPEGMCQVIARDAASGASVQATVTPGRVIVVLSHSTFQSRDLAPPPDLARRWTMDLQISPGLTGGFVVPLDFGSGVFRATLPRSLEVEAGVLAILQGAEISTGRRGPINISAILPPANALLGRVRTCMRQLEEPPADIAPGDAPPGRRT